jgi:outer membrane translocation and assembly module TamA
LLRGYFLGRYRDRKLAAVQFELRLPTSEKWGAVLYTGAGDVAPTWDKMTFASSKPAGGAGVRYRISDAQKVNLRLDFAWGVKTPNPSVYLSLAEAF